ncbi:type III-B CRISPR-associated protein Cas10/Cmr2 [Thermococcus sp.]|uniref:type III-B CRISPR-associated protein Cas10/Cmr2 n=1 Tax=Thermococcus sp. TaxID=35749 RepID=UPI0026021C9A|nr:type III-B CRISPR-associated protein Cas10/Cmr2 [Thermococcus sp.]
MIPQTYAQAFLEVAPSKILGSLLDEGKPLPSEWKHLSSYPANGKPEKFVLRHPISAKEKELKNINEFWFQASDEEKRRFIDALERAEKIVAKGIRNAGSIEKFAKLWNRLPGLLREEYEKALEENGFNPAMAEELVHFPADPMVPDHDWLSRLDVYASLKAGDVKLIRFKLSPVQGFIANARTERDLWAGSHILSLLTYLAISELWRKYGPHSIIFPHMRGQPFFEHELGELEDEQKLMIGNMPNKVLAIVPTNANLESLEKRIRERITSFFVNLFKAAWNFYEMGKHFEWDEKYVETLAGYFSITLEDIPLKQLDPSGVISENLKKYLLAIKDEKESEIHSYSELFLLLDQLTDFKSRDYVRPEQDAGFKCTLCGEHLAIGGDANHETVREEWRDFVKTLHSRGIYDIKTGERLCPLCLVKRFYRRFYPLWVEKYPRVSDAHLGELIKEHFEGNYLDRMAFASVSEVAIRRPTEKAIERCIKGELYVEENDRRKPVTWADVYKWILHNLEIEKSQPPKFGGSRVAELTPKLYSLSSALLLPFKRLAPNSEVLYIENLRDTKTLAKVYGTDENDPRLKGVNIEGIRDAVEELAKLIGEPPKYYAILKMDGDNMGKVISGTKGVKSLREYSLGKAPDIPRPVTPPIHIAITRSLSGFAVGKVPEESMNRNAELLYAGGDDVFALVPADGSVELAHRLQEHFRTDWDGYEPLQGHTRSMSAGLLVVYYKEPLYSAVRRVNELEHLAKESGRNALAIGYLKHSGSYYRIVVNWGLFEGLNERGCEEDNKNDAEEIPPLQSLLKELRENEKGLSNRIIYEVAEGVETWPNNTGAVLNLLKYELMRHSNYGEEKEREVFNRFAEFLWVARHVRVKVSEREVKELGIDPGKKALRMLTGRLNGSIERIIADDPEREEPDESFEDLKRELQDLEGSLARGGFWFGRLERELEKELSSAGVGKDLAREIAGLVLRKQLRGAAYLLKVLLEMGVGA